MSQPVLIRIWSDFVCPWCYVGLVEVEKLKKDFDVTVDWRPFLLRPDTPPEGSPPPEYVLARMADPNNPLKLRAAQEGLKMVDHAIVPSTRRAHEVAELAREHGRIDALHASLLRRYWEQDEDLYALSTLRGAGQDAGLNPDEVEAAVQSGRYRPVVDEALRSAREMGVSAVPTFLVGDRLLIQGAQPQAVFRQAMERLGAKPRSS